MGPYHVEITGWRDGLRKISMTHALQDHAGLGLAAAKAITDLVLESGRADVALPAREAAERLAAELRALGAEATVRTAGGARFELWRQDDNGNRVLIRQFEDRVAAEAEAARLDALGHRQVYWVEGRAPACE